MEKERKGYHKMLVWKKGRELILLIYQHTENFPRSEEFGLKNQLRRSAVSIVLNIVEGYRRRTRKDYIHFLNITEGSLSELEAALEICYDLSFISKENYETLEEKCREVGFLLWRLIKGLEKNP